jgi:hypothetical protein
MNSAENGESTMTELLEKAFAEAAKLPPEEQEWPAAWICEELATEACWQQTFVASADALAQLADEALAEYCRGETRELEPDWL